MFLYNATRVKNSKIAAFYKQGQNSLFRGKLTDIRGKFDGNGTQVKGTLFNGMEEHFKISMA